jgi:hypothetical protein
MTSAICQFRIMQQPKIALNKGIFYSLSLGEVYKIAHIYVYSSKYNNVSNVNHTQSDENRGNI